MNTTSIERDIPIIFSGPMVRALLEGRKTMTRRLALTSRRLMEESKPGRYRSKTKIMDSPWKSVKPGDRMWVRESLKHITSDPVSAEPCSLHCYSASIPHGMDSANPYEDNYLFPDDGAPNLKPKSVPSIHMPRWASRLTLIVTGVKVERLQDISEDDAKAEGVEAVNMIDVPRQAAWTNRGDFAQLWNKLHGADAWDANPEVVALSFQVIKANIDTPAARLAA